MPSSMVAAWQQDRWSSGGAHGIVAASSVDGGQTWLRTALPFSRCAGGTSSNQGDYARATDPWLSAAPDGRIHLLALAYSGGVLQAGSSNAMLAVYSDDNGQTWSQTQTLIHDGVDYFNDKGSITADPVTPGYVYAVWDRINGSNSGPTMLARSTDNGLSWEPARVIYATGTNEQTLGNIVAVLPNGIVLDLFSSLSGTNNSNLTASLAIIRSTDNGATWSAPTTIASELPVGTSDPRTGSPVRDGSLVPAIAVGPGGNTYVTWQDSRFSNGARDGIAMSYSQDGGVTWSAPSQVNGMPGAAAFLPNVHVLANGTVGVTYYDFRSDTSDTATLYTDYWLGYSTDAQNWFEIQVAGPFDMNVAPVVAEGGPSAHFIGDYQALSGMGTTFVPLFVQTTNSGASNPTDVFAAPAVSATTSTANKAKSSYVVTTVSERATMHAYDASPQWQSRVRLNLQRSISEHRRERKTSPEADQQ